MRWFLFWIVFAVSASTHGQVIFVDKDAAEGGDGTSWGTAYRYLQDALQVATGTSEIWIAEGTYYPEQYWKPS